MGPQSNALIRPVSLCLIRGAGLGLKMRDVQGKSVEVFTFCPETVPLFVGQQQVCLNMSDRASL